jgi:hypothetical protein
MSPGRVKNIFVMLSVAGKYFLRIFCSIFFASLSRIETVDGGKILRARDKTRQFTLHKQVQGKVKIELKTERENAKKAQKLIFSFLYLPLCSTERFVPCLYCQLALPATQTEKFSIIARTRE